MPILVSYATFALLASRGAIGTYVLRGASSATTFVQFNGSLYTATVLETDFANFAATLQPTMTEASSVNDAMALAVFLPQGKAPNQNVQLVSLAPRRGTELVMTTHNYCDPTTWYTESVRVDDETLVDSGDGLTFTSANANWIDLAHGKLWSEDAVRARIGHGYAVIVEVDGIVKTERTPFGADGDFVVDYAAGTVTFVTMQVGSVVATYSHENGSRWKLIPDAGKVIVIESAKVLWTEDMTLEDSVVSDTFIDHPAILGQKLLVQSSRYKTMANVLMEAEVFYPAMPAIAGPRGVTATCSAQYRYGTVTELTSAIGMETHVRLANDVPCGGSCAAVTFYCTVATL